MAQSSAHPRITRRAVLVAALATGAVLIDTSARGEEVAVPVKVQAGLIGKIVAYDRNLDQRAGDRIRVAIVVDGSSPDSARVGAQMRAALGELPTLGGKPHEEQIISFKDEKSFADAMKSGKVSLVYVTPGLGGTVDRVVAALDGAPILTFSALPDDVHKKVVVGFDVIGGKPKLLIHLAQSRRQGVAFSAELLKLAKVIG